MSDFTFWSDVSTVISYTYFSYSASHALLQQSLPSFLYILSIFGTRWPALRGEWTAVKWSSVAWIRLQDGQCWSKWKGIVKPYSFSSFVQCAHGAYCLLSTVTQPSVSSSLPGSGPHHSLKTCLWVIDYSASLIKFTYSEEVQTCNNVECLDR